MEDSVVALVKTVQRLARKQHDDGIQNAVQQLWEAVIDIKSRLKRDATLEDTIHELYKHATDVWVRVCVDFDHTIHDKVASTSPQRAHQRAHRTLLSSSTTQGATISFKWRHNSGTQQGRHCWVAVFCGCPGVYNIVHAHTGCSLACKHRWYKPPRQIVHDGLSRYGVEKRSRATPLVHTLRIPPQAAMCWLRAEKHQHADRCLADALRCVVCYMYGYLRPTHHQRRPHPVMLSPWNAPLKAASVTQQQCKAATSM